MMPDSTAENLRLINGKLRAVLSAWQPDPSQTGAFTPTVFIELLAELRRAAELLVGIPQPSTPDRLLEEELADYHCQVKQLEKILPAIQGRLLSEKARLESARAHLSAASAWADGRKKTL